MVLCFVTGKQKGRSVARRFWSGRMVSAVERVSDLAPTVLASYDLREKASLPSSVVSRYSIRKGTQNMVWQKASSRCVAGDVRR